LLLSDERVDVQAKNRRGEQAIHIAVKENTLDHLKLLLAHPLIDPLAKKSDRWDAMSLALSFSRIEISEFLKGFLNK
jgi:ankyrin repeat protein